MQVINMYDKTEVYETTVCQCIEFVRTNDLQALPVGKYEIDDKRIYVVISEYQSVPSSDKVWEAHCEYVDLQVVISGEEMIQVSPIIDMQCGKYVPEDDFLPCEGIAKENIIMKAGVGVLLFPEDAHKPGVISRNAQLIKKAVFKIHKTYLDKDRLNVGVKGGNRYADGRHVF